MKTYELNREEFLAQKKINERQAKQVAEKQRFTFEFKDTESDEEKNLTQPQDFKQKVEQGMEKLNKIKAD